MLACSGSWKTTEPQGESFAKPHPIDEREGLKLRLKLNFQLSLPHPQIYLIQDELDTPERDIEFNRVFTGRLKLIYRDSIDLSSHSK